MDKFTQIFVVYHGCGNGYVDGTNKIVRKGRKCFAATFNPFWKRPIDVHNKVETKAQLKIKTKASRYRRFVNTCLKDSFTSSDFNSDPYSNSDRNADNESLANYTSETEKKLFSDDETNRKLIINETTKTEQNLSLNPESLATNTSAAEKKLSDNLNKTSETEQNS